MGSPRRARRSSQGEVEASPAQCTSPLWGPYPFIQTGDVKAANRIIRSFTQTYSEEGLEQSRMWPAGTLCITIAANIAETAFLGFDGCFPDSIVGFTACEPLIHPEYVHFFFESAKYRIAAHAPSTAQKNINLSTLEKPGYPLLFSGRSRRFLSRRWSLASACWTSWKGQSARRHSRPTLCV